MAELAAILITILGPVAASYFAVLVSREHDPKSVAGGRRSQCDSCGNTLAWYELVPVLSFMLLRGKCKVCKKPIAWQSFVAEILGLALLGGLGMGLVIERHNWGLELLAVYLIWFVFSLLLLYLSIYDLYTYTIPSKFTDGALLAILAVAIGLNAIDLLIPGLDLSWLPMAKPDALLLSIVFAGLTYALIFFSKQTAMGDGDVYIVAMIGLLLGWPLGFMALYLAAIAGGLVGLGVAAVVRKMRGVRVPYIPILLLGVAGAFALGSTLYNTLFYPLIPFGI